MEVWGSSKTRPTSSRKRWRGTASTAARTRERIPKDAAARFSLGTSVAIQTEAKRDFTTATVTEVRTDPRALGNRPTSWSDSAERASRAWTGSRNGEETTWISSGRRCCNDLRIISFFQNFKLLELRDNFVLWKFFNDRRQFCSVRCLLRIARVTKVSSDYSWKITSRKSLELYPRSKCFNFFKILYPSLF